MVSNRDDVGKKGQIMGDIDGFYSQADGNSLVGF